MTDAPKKSTEERLAELEVAVEKIQRSLRMLGVPGGGSRHKEPQDRSESPTQRARYDEAASRPLIRQRAEPTPATPGVFSTLLNRGPQFWISRVGIVLLLVGVAYLFKYAVDQGWLTPWIRVAFGLVLGAALAAIGFRVQQRQRWFTQVMLGGAAATWYITGFAAFQLLHLVGFPVAFGFMVFVTVFTFWASLQQGEPALAILAAIGGLGTPFFLYTEAGSVRGLMVYTSIVLLGTSAIYLSRGWKSLLWVTAVDAWAVVLLAFQDASTTADRVALQAGVLVIWLLFWLVPAGREVLSERDPMRWPRSTWHILRGRDRGWLHHDLALLVLLTAATTFFVSLSVWSPDESLWGIIALVGAGIYAVATGTMRRWPGMTLQTSAHAVTAAVLAAIGFNLLFESDLVIFLWALEAGVLRLLNSRFPAQATGTDDEPILNLDVAAHILHAVVGIWLLERLFEGGSPETAVLNARAVSDAAVIAVSLVTTKWVVPKAVPWYSVIVHVAILAWLAREFSALPGGDGVVTAAWGTYALGLLFFLRSARKVALATLFLAVAKLVVHDLSQVEPIWRILLFLSFGGVFLAISYYFKDLLSSPKQDRDSAES